MNVTLLEKICKKESRKCFEEFKRCIMNYPLGSVNNEAINDTLEFQILQVFKRSVLKEYIDEINTEKQKIIVEKTVKKYETLIVSTAKTWSMKRFKNLSL